MNSKFKIIGACLILSFMFTSSSNAFDEVPPVPTSDGAVRQKEVGITIFGFTVPGITLDGIAIAIARNFLQSIVNDTVDWINNGFDGNPAFVRDPLKRSLDIAENIADEFISGSDLAQLCSPFQNQIRLALRNTQRNATSTFQCTLDEVISNIENFYDDFDQGGWDAWFAMTQNGNNNPYGAYLNAQLELDNRIARELSVDLQKLNWGSGLLSYEQCPAGQNEAICRGSEFTVRKKVCPDGNPPFGNPTGDPANNALCAFGVQPTIVETKVCDGQTENKCRVAKEIITPGSAINSQLNNVLGTGVRQLELADELDELVTALFNQLLKRTVLGAQGLFRGGSSQSSTTTNNTSVRPPTPITNLLDIDGDSVNDGIDTNRDNVLDICYFGGLTDGVDPPCIGSVAAGIVPPVINQPDNNNGEVQI